MNEGRGRWTVGEIEYDAGVGDIVLAPAGTLHKFVNASNEIMRHTSIQLTGTLGAALHRDPISDTAEDLSEIDG